MRRYAFTALAGSVLALCSSLALAGGLLVVAPHPDDDLLIAAGVIASAKARGEQVKVVFMTNGDFDGQAIGLLREGEAVSAQVQHLGTSEDDLIFLGYPDGGLHTIAASYPAVTDAFLGSNNRTTTYGNRGLGLADYHSHHFGAPALYNRANIVADLQSIVSAYQPDHIVTTAEHDKHPDHATTFQLVKDAINAAIAANPGYNPGFHKGLVWANFIDQTPAWPTLPDPGGYHAPLPASLASQLAWGDRESLDVPLAMQATNFALNAKYQSIDSHASQGGANSLLGRFVHKDEIFWLESLSGATLPPRASAGPGQTVASGAAVQLNGAGSVDPNHGTLTYSWRQIGGSPVLLTGANTVAPAFQAPNNPLQDDVLSFELVTGNGAASSLPDTVSITVLAVGRSTENIAPLAQASASSETGADEQFAQSAIDGVVDGYPGDYTREWATQGEGVGAWLKLEWPLPANIYRIALFDRPNGDDFITAGTLTFSDGSSVAVPALLNGGGRIDVSFAARTVSWVQFTATAVSPATQNAGLAEIQAYGYIVNDPPVAIARATPAVASGVQVRLDGSASSDAQHSPLTYQWQQTGGPAVALSSDTAQQPTFTAPVDATQNQVLTFALVVNDGVHSSLPATLHITVLSAQDLNGNTLADSWESYYGAADPNADPDGDGFTNLQEFNAGTHPQDAAPTVAIAAPVAGATYTIDTPIAFAASASDTEDGNLSAAIRWYSNSAGLLGSGATLDKTLAVGTHTITATVADSKGAAPKTIPSVQIQVIAAARNGDINGDGEVDVADAMWLQQYLSGARTLDADAIARGDLYPAATGDNQLTLSDLLLLEKLLISDN